MSGFFDSQRHFAGSCAYGNKIKDLERKIRDLKSQLDSERLISSGLRSELEATKKEKSDVV